MKIAINASVMGWLLLAALLPGPAPAEVPIAKPYGQIVSEVTAFLFSDVGNGGIRTNDNEPDDYPVPPYFYHFGIYDTNDLWSSTSGYPWHSAISYPGYTASIAIDAFLDYYRYSGDPEAIDRARAFADWIIEHRTPAGDLYGNLPYSTQAEGQMGGAWDGDAIMTDKPAMFGSRLLRLFDATGDSLYRNAALEIAQTLAATQLGGGLEDAGRWPFRVRPADGLVRQDYTSHLQPAVRFFDDLAGRTGDPAHAAARDDAWSWLLNNPCNPASESYMRWEAFYEDQDPAMQTGKRDHYSAHEMIVELIERQPADWQQTATDILDWTASLYLIDQTGNCLGDYFPATNEWQGWMEPTYAATLQFARTALMLYQALEGHALQDTTYRDWAYAMASVCSHGQNQRGLAADGRTYTTVKDIRCSFTDKSWYEQNFNVVKYYLELMALDSDLAPANENHMLWSERTLRWITYLSGDTSIRYQVAGGGGQERLRLMTPPSEVLAGGAALPALPDPGDPGPGWHWDQIRGVLTVRHAQDPVEIVLSPTAVGGIGGGGESGPPADRLRVNAAAIANGGLTAAEVHLATAGRVSARIHDLRGRLVKTVWDGERLPEGITRLQWDGRDGRGRQAAAGVYILRVEALDETTAVRLILIR